MWSHRSRALAAAVACVALVAAAPGMDPENPTCPAALNFSDYPQMRFTLAKRGSARVLLAEGRVDGGVETRLATALAENEPIDEIWFRSPGGNAKAGNAAGRLIRSAAIPTRIPAGWACFSACNFMFMGGIARSVDPGGQFVVHMFTHLSDRGAIEQELKAGTDSALDLIGDVEQGSALLASEDNDFLIRMGMSRKLLTNVMYRQKALKEQGEDRSTRRCLTSAELLEYNVANPS